MKRFLIKIFHSLSILNIKNHKIILIKNIKYTKIFFNLLKIKNIIKKKILN